MSTIRQDISNIRALIRQVQDDSPYEDQLLYSLLTIASSKLQEQHNKNLDKDFQWTTFCVPLEKAKSHDCDCVEVGCDVLKSVYKIPNAQNGRRGLLFKVETLGDILIPNRNPQEIKDAQLDDIKKNRLGWYLQSNKLIIWNNLKLKAIQVTGIWEDITQWNGKQLCDEEGDPLPSCEDVMDQSISLEQYLKFDAYKMVLSLLRIPLSIPEDHTVDNNPNIKA